MKKKVWYNFLPHSATPVVGGYVAPINILATNVYNFTHNLEALIIGDKNVSTRCR